MDLSISDIDLLEDWWVQKSRANFMAYRRYMREGDFMYNWFTTSMAEDLQQFYVDYIAGLRPILIINTPPQHGKSWGVTDFVSWVVGKHSKLRIIYSSFSKNLGVRANNMCQRTFDSKKYNKIYPDFRIHKGSHYEKAVKMKAKRDSEQIDFWEDGYEGDRLGYFRNTTVEGSVTGETLDIGIIDDPVKGRKEANSVVKSQTIWEWYNDDFSTRFDDKAGLILIMTRWATTDLAGRLLEKKGHKVRVRNYQALATKDEKHRKTGDPLFPKLKSLEFLEDKKDTMFEAYWEALYQGNPTVDGGNIFKDSWWGWYKKKYLPKIKFKFIVVDTAQKDKTQHDWTVFHCWGMGYDGNIYLLDRMREKFQSPDLRREGYLFYKKHDTPRIEIDDPVLRGMYVEDKSSGIGFIQEMRKKSGVKVFEVKRNTDKVLRANDASPYVRIGRVILCTEIPGVDNLTKEGREFPNSEFDDEIDVTISAIELAYIDGTLNSNLQAAMEATQQDERKMRKQPVAKKPKVKEKDSGISLLSAIEGAKQ